MHIFLYANNMKVAWPNVPTGPFAAHTSIATAKALPLAPTTKPLYTSTAMANTLPPPPKTSVLPYAPTYIDPQKVRAIQSSRALAAAREQEINNRTATKKGGKKRRTRRRRRRRRHT